MRKFLYLILFVMTLCVFFCSCSQKTNDVKKTSSQHEKKLKSVPNNNTKEDVISEEDLEKGYDLPVSAQENEDVGCAQHAHHAARLGLVPPSRHAQQRRRHRRGEPASSASRRC